MLFLMRSLYYISSLSSIRNDSCCILSKLLIAITKFYAHFLVLTTLGLWFKLDSKMKFALLRWTFLGKLLLSVMIVIVIN